MSDPYISRTIDHYTIVSRVGKGGMATVYRARQTNMQRDVAIKIMSADLAADPEFVARFEREAQVIANLQHPRILPVFDFGHEGEDFYLVMRLVEGESLFQRLLNGALAVVTAARYVNQIAEALDYAHAQGVIHRDLKPNNVLIDAWDNLYLMDFGLAKMLAASQSLTQTGTVLGTPAYMAPEQWRGEPVDARTDVYSLGIILYEMVVGHTPFESDTPYTLMYKHINDAPPAPCELQPNLPPEVERVMLRALAKEREDRYASAGEMARALTAALQASGAEQAEQLAPPPEITPAPPRGEDLPLPEDVVPPPAQIFPPPPPIPVPGKAKRYAPAPDARPPDSDTPRFPSSLREALEVVDHSVEAAVAKAAEVAPPLRGGSNDYPVPVGDGMPADAPACRQMRRVLAEEEPLVGVLDVRGTPDWNVWKGLFIGGLALMILGGVVNVGLFNAIGVLMWFYLGAQAFRTWRGDIGRYYLGFTPRRVVLLPRDSENRPRFDAASSAGWNHVQRLRLTGRYVLLDMPGERAREIHVGALVAAQGEGGLGDQGAWLPQSPLIDLIEDQGFDAQMS